MASTQVLKFTSIGLGLVLFGTFASIIGGGSTAVAATSCVAPAGTVTQYAANTAATYTPVAGTTYVQATASGGAGSKENGDQEAGGAGAKVVSVLAVPGSGSFDVAVGQDASHDTGGQSGAIPSGGMGDTYSPPGDSATYYSGGGGGATFISSAGTILLAAGAGGGAGFGNPGGAAAGTTKTSVAAGAVSSGADGDGLAQSPANGGVSGLGGDGGSATPGAGGAATPGYGAGNGQDAVGNVGGSAFVDGGHSVGSGAGGGGYKGGGGGGGGGFAGGGGAGSSYSVSAYSIISNGSAAPALTFETLSAPAFQSASTATFVQNTHGSFTVCAPSLDDPAITETGALPAGLTFVDNGNGTATITGSATSSPASFPLTITSTGVAGATTQSFVLTVTPGLAKTGTDPSAGELLALVLLLGGAILLSARRARSRLKLRSTR